MKGSSTILPQGGGFWVAATHPKVYEGYCALGGTPFHSRGLGRIPLRVTAAFEDAVTRRQFDNERLNRVIGFLTTVILIVRSCSRAVSFALDENK